MKRFGIAVKAFIVRDDKLLIIKRRPDDVQKPGIWEIPGGRLDPGESPFDGLKREVKEETSIDIEILNPLGVRHFERKDGQVITMIIFLCKALSDNVVLSEEHTDFEWKDIDNIKEKLSDYFHAEVDAYKKIYKQS